MSFDQEFYLQMLFLIPDLPEGISDESAMDFYSKLAGNLQDQSSIHINWFTHRGNPSVCWICDLNILLTKVIAMTDSNITKSTVDLETVVLSEDEHDSEIEGIENSLNYDDEGVPEYDTEEEQ